MANEVFQWGNARRQLEQELNEARRLREIYEKRENEVLESLQALDITVDTLNKLPEGVNKLVLMALRANSTMEYVKQRGESRLEGLDEKVPVVSVQRPLQAAKPPKPPKVTKAVERAAEREIARNKPRVYGLLHTDRGTRSADIANILELHITTVSKVLAAGERMGELRWEKDTNDRYRGAARRKSWFLVQEGQA